jgi:hypothetical protein
MLIISRKTQFTRPSLGLDIVEFVTLLCLLILTSRLAGENLVGQSHPGYTPTFDHPYSARGRSRATFSRAHGGPFPSLAQASL